jgi:hypothetical protein
MLYLPEERRTTFGMKENTVRLSAGIEKPDALIKDMAQALGKERESDNHDAGRLALGVFSRSDLLGSSNAFRMKSIAPRDREETNRQAESGDERTRHPERILRFRFLCRFHRVASANTVPMLLRLLQCHSLSSDKGEFNPLM